ncbi:hypothetical protein [Arsenophonus sp. PmNCSU2021_1]
MTVTRGPHKTRQNLGYLSATIIN